MSGDPATITALAERVRAALASGDLDAFAGLLDPQVRWGPPDDTTWGCHSRREVLAWYRRGHARGVRADVTEVQTTGDRIMIAMNVRTPGSVPEGGVARYQVLTVSHGLVVDIRGFESRDAAASRMG
jgi:SnoaL-like domain